MICGICIAIDACGAIQGIEKKLSYVTSLILVAVSTLVLEPMLVKALRFPDIVGSCLVGV